MLREKNIEERDAFFKTIDQDIKRMSGMDLSKQQNVDSASSIFNQMLDNKGIVKDMVWTKNWQKEHQRADGFRNCIDPEKCGGAWWEGGVNALNYMADEFKNATDDEAMNFSNAKYTPYQDVMGKAIKLAKEADLNVTMDQKTGGYIVTTKNGPNLLAKPLASLFMGTLGKDPKIMEYYKTKAYVDRKGWISSKIPELGSREAAEQAYIQEMTQKTTPKLTKAEQDIKDAQENIGNQRKGLENEIRKKGTTPTSALADMYRKSLATEQQLNASGEVISDANGNMKVGLSNAGTRAALGNLDAAMAAQYLQDDIGNAAMTLAYKDYSQTMEADPFAMENLRHSHAIALSKINYQKTIGAIDYKFNLEKQAQLEEATGGAMANMGAFVTVDSKTGAVEVNYEDSDDPELRAKAFHDRQKLEDEAAGILGANEKQMLIEAFTTMQTESTNKDQTKSAGAKADLITMGDAIMNTVKKNDPAWLRKYNNFSDDQKLKMLQKFDFTSGVMKLTNDHVDGLYQDALYPMMDMNTESNTVNRAYLNNLWSSAPNIAKRNAIRTKNLVLESLNQGHQRNTAKVKADILALDSDVPRPMADALNAFIDENGVEKDEATFIKDYVDQTIENTPDQMFKSWGGSPVPSDDPYTTFLGAAIGPVQRDEAGNPIKTATDFNAIRANATEEAKEMYANLNDEDSGMMQMWREAYSKHAVALGQTDLQGSGSKAVAKAQLLQADPVNFQSLATTGFMGTTKDVFSAINDQQATVALGGLSAGIPESSEQAEAILRQIRTDMATRGNPKDKSRPVLDLTVQNIAGGNSDWMAVNIKVDDAYASQYTGTKGNQGLLYEQRVALQKEGITMYLKKEAATNQFYLNSKQTDMDVIMHYNKEYKIDDFPEYFDGSLTKMEGGGYNLTGMMMTGLDKMGKPITNPVVNQYWSSDTDPDWIMQDFREKLLNPTVAGVKQDQAAYNMNGENSTRDPNSL
jgi:hypothetical protein